MLAVVCEARTRDLSSFGKLANYMEYGNGQSMQIDTETGEVIARGEMLYSEAILDARHAVAEMEAVALQNSRVADPIFHYILAWQEGEQPSREQWETAVQSTQKAMGMADHQFVAALHKDGATWHVHVMANRVNPDTYRAADLWKCHERLDVAIREVEHVQGWQESHGLARWQDGRAVLLTKEEKKALREAREAREDTPQRGAAKVETYRDAESFAAWMKGEPAKALDAVMKRDGATWQDVHAELARFGVTLHRTENGKMAGFTVSCRDENGKEIHAKASEALRKHFAGKKAREATDAKLGAWLAPTAPEANTASTPIAAEAIKPEAYSTGRTKRDPGDRAERKAERDRARMMLKAEYQDYRLAWKRDEQHRRAEEGKQLKSAMAEIADRRRERATAIRRQKLPKELRQVALSVIAAEAIQARAAVRAELAQERQERRAPDYRAWVEARAAEGRADALAQLRGFRYADQRRAQPAQPDGLAGAAGGRYDPAGPHGFTRAQPAELRLTWAVDRKRGHVVYSLDDRRAFVDEGRNVRLVKGADGRTERDQVRVALQLAVQKFGPSIKLTGSEAFRRQAVEVAVASGMRVRFAGPEDEQYRQQLTNAREASRTRQAGQHVPGRPTPNPGHRPPVSAVPPPFARGKLRTLGQLGELAKDGGPIARPIADPLEGYRVAVTKAEAHGALAVEIAKAQLAVAQEYHAAGENLAHQSAAILAAGQQRAIDQIREQERMRPPAAPSRPAPIASAPMSDEDRKRAENLAAQHVREFRSLAAKRKGKMPGYRDGQGDWSATPAELRERLERFNAMTPERQAVELASLQRETVERYARDPAAAARDRARGRDRGRDS